MEPKAIQVLVKKYEYTSKIQMPRQILESQKNCTGQVLPLSVHHNSRSIGCALSHWRPGGHANYGALPHMTLTDVLGTGVW